jgi:hypothetical protein
MLEVLRRSVESTLTASVGVVHEPVEVLAGLGAVPDRLLEGVQGEVGAQ